MNSKVIEVLQKVFDPELPVNIYDLGLIYDIEIDMDNNVHIKMTLTSPACPVAGTLPPQVEERVKEIEGVRSAKVELIWEPPWTQDRMSEVAKLALNLEGDSEPESDYYQVGHKNY